MPKVVFFGLLFASVTALLMARPAFAGEKKADDQAKEIVGRFSKAMFAKDVDGSLKLMDVPWVGLFSNDLVKDREELKKQWAQFLKDANFEGDPKLEIKEVLTFPQFREKYKEKIDKKISKALDQLKLTADDRVVLEQSGKSGGSAILVRMRDGKPKIVGIIE